MTASITRHLVTLLAVLVGGQLLPSLHAPAGAAPSVAPSWGVLMGAWVGNKGGLPHYDSVLKFEKKIGRKLAIDQHFRKWDNEFWGEELKDIAAGRIPMITWGDWGKTSAKEIANGSEDALIRQKAAAFKALGAPVFLRWGAEPAGGKYGSAEDYIAAWKRIRALFAAEGATNVMWVWCPTAWSFKAGDAQKYYPGDSQVDWIAANGFNFHPEKGPWKSFRQIFKYFYEWGKSRGKPLMIGGTGAMEHPDRPKAKARWIRGILPTLKDWPKIKAFNYFHATSPKGYDFWADTSKPSKKAFKWLVNRACLNP